MNALARTSTQYVLGINATLVLWLWASRFLVGLPGWGLVLVPVFILSWLVPLVLLTSVLTRRRYPAAVREETPGRHGMTMFSRPQAVAQLTAWVGMAGAGLFLVDSDDSRDGSIVTVVLDPLLGGVVDLLVVSIVTSIVFGCLFGVGWLALLVMLCTDSPRMTATRRALDEEARREDDHEHEDDVREESPRTPTVSGTA